MDDTWRSSRVEYLLRQCSRDVPNMAVLRPKHDKVLGDAIPNTSLPKERHAIVTKRRKLP